MTPGIDAKKEDQKPKRTTGIGVCTHLFIMMAGLLVSNRGAQYVASVQFERLAIGLVSSLA